MSKRYRMYRAQDLHIFEVDATTYAWAPQNHAACQVSAPAARALSFLAGAAPPQPHTLAEIQQHLDGDLTPVETRKLLDELEKIGLVTGIDRHTRPFSAINLLLTTRCNMNCLYCYGGAGREQGLPGGSYGLAGEDMSPATARLAVDYLLKTAAQRAGGDPGGINFFGGEPLVNREALRAVLAYAEEQAARFALDLPHFSITTNGTLIDDEFLDLARRFELSVQVSFDGTRSAQEQLRPFPESYDVVCRAFERLAAHHIPVRVRATLTSLNTSVMDTLRNLESLGVEQVHFAPATARALGSLKLDEADIDRLLQEFQEAGDYMLARIVAGEPFVRCNNLLSTVETIHNKREKRFCCGAGIGLVSVAPDGRLFLCHRFVGYDDLVIGHIETGIDHRRRFELLQELDMEAHDQCQDCWCRDLCGGGCPQSNYECTTRLSAPDPLLCALEKGLAHIAIHFASRLRQSNEDAYWKIVGE